MHEPRKTAASAAADWAPRVRFTAAEQRLGQAAERRPVTAFLHEFLRFGIKQGWASLFGGAMVALIVGTWLWYPRDAALSRYDFMFLMALAVQAGMRAFRLETLEEAKVILIYHVVGTIMEVFKTEVGSCHRCDGQEFEPTEPLSTLSRIIVSVPAAAPTGVTISPSRSGMVPRSRAMDRNLMMTVSDAESVQPFRFSVSWTM